MIRNKQGAIELSVSTIVVLVIGMTMLIMGILLVKNIFSSAYGSVDIIDQGVKNEINKLFADSGKKVVVRLPNNEVKIKKGEDFGIAFGIRNTEEGDGTPGIFTYKIKTFDIEKDCRLTTAQSDAYLRLGDEYAGQDLKISPGDDPKYLVVRIQPSDDAPLCDVQYIIDVAKDGQHYESEIFTVNVIGN